jgi:hypothetical protein
MLKLRYGVREMIQTIPVADVWDQGFAALENVSEKFAGLSDDDLDALFGEALSTSPAASQSTPGRWGGSPG